MLFYFACEAAGALSARHSLRPLMFQMARATAKLGHAPRERGGVSNFGVVPAHAGTHNHKRSLEQKLSATVPNREATEYGSLLSQGRRRTVRGEIAEVSVKERILTSPPPGLRCALADPPH